MQRIVQRELYREGLKYFELNDITKLILKPIIAGDDKATDFEDCLKTDPVVSRQIILDANLQLKNGSVQSISHAVVLIGKNRVRDFIFSNCILACTTDDQDSIFKKILNEKNFLIYAEETEALTKKLGGDFSGGAWAAGFLFDFLNHLLIHRKLQLAFEVNFKALWEHSTKTAALAWSFANFSKQSSSQCRQAFMAGLTHDIGRILMWLIYPEESAHILKEFTRHRENKQWQNTLELEVEKKYLNVSHCEIGSMLLIATEYMSEIEEVVAFHHDIELLKLRSSKVLQIAQCVNLADEMAESISGKLKFSDEEIANTLKSLSVQSSLQASNVAGIIENLKSKQIL